MKANCCRAVWLILLISSCGSPSNSPKDTADTDSIRMHGAFNFMSVMHATSGGSAYADSIFLKFSVDQTGQVDGIYQWVLPGKDGKYGTINGLLRSDTIDGRFVYRQEGGQYDDSIQIVLTPGRAIVTQLGPEGNQLTDTLPVWNR